MSYKLIGKHFFCIFSLVTILIKIKIQQGWVFKIVKIYIIVEYVIFLLIIFSTDFYYFNLLLISCLFNIYFIFI